MIERLENDQFDTKVEASDWRYSASILGLYKYLSFYSEEDKDFIIDEESIRFNWACITEKNYFLFVENYYGEELPYRKLEKLIKQEEEYSDERIKLINELLKGNSIMKKVFGKLKFDGTNSQEILDLIDEKRLVLIKETFRNKSNMYANFANPGQLLEQGKSCCRLWGYYVDGGRKSKSISYNFDVNTFVAQDDIIFDFIPFSFLGEREALFINDSFSVKQLIDTNINFEHFLQKETESSSSKSKDARKVLFQSIQAAADFLDYDVEVILKNRDASFFETLYIRQDSIDILKKIKIYEPFCFSLKVNENYYINVQKKVMDCILNLIRMDELIELFLKRKEEYLVSQFIQINQLICEGGEKMNQSMKRAYACAKEVVKKLPANKRESYRQKLTSAIIFKDYDRYIEILLQLCNYTDGNFEFAYDLFEDFERNKDIAYTFINALTKKSEDNQGGTK